VSNLTVSCPVESSDVFTVSFFASETGQIQGAQLTHENLTAGVSATRAVLPISHVISPLDTIVSAHSLSTAYGRAIAYTALFEGTNFATLESSKLLRIDEGGQACICLRPLLVAYGVAETFKTDVTDVLSAKPYPIPSPTIFFVKPGHLDSLASSILKQARKSFLVFPFAWRHKFAGISEGFITKDSLWDRLLLDNTRARVIGEGAGTLRALIVSGGM
jgi:long-chain acyl-CoA synthetase